MKNIKDKIRGLSRSSNTWIVIVIPEIEGKKMKEEEINYYN